MKKKPRREKSTSVTIKGSVTGQIAIGENNTQSQSEVHYSITAQELGLLRQMLNDLRAKVESVAQPEKKDSALEQVQKLEKVVTGKKLNLSKMESVKNWFGKNVPALAGAVTSVVVHPIVGKLVEAGGDLLVKDFQRRFGGNTQ